MKKIFQFITAIAIVVPIVDSASSEPSSSQTEHASPFACNAMALSPEVRKRHFEELGPALLKLKKSIRELPDGYEFELPADNKTYQLLTEWAFQERLCCPFFDISLRLDREGGPLWLRLTGRPGTKEFIKEELGILSRKSDHYAIMVERVNNTGAAVARPCGPLRVGRATPCAPVCESEAAGRGLPALPIRPATGPHTGRIRPAATRWLQHL